MEIDLIIDDRDKRGFLIHFQNVMIMWSSIVDEIVLLERRVNNSWFEKILHGRRTEVDAMDGYMSCPGIVKLVKRFKETGSLEDQPRNGWPSLVESTITDVETIMNNLAVEPSTGSNSVRKAGRITDMFHSPIRRILHGTLHFCPYKLQSL